MARPIKQGLEYFPIDVDMFDDDKFQLTIAKHGPTVERVVLRLLMSLYRVGYCYRWEPRDRTIFASKIGVPLAQVEEIVSDLIEDKFFDKNKLEKYGILTSKGIQKRYLEATRKRSSGGGIIDKNHDLTRSFRGENAGFRAENPGFRGENSEDNSDETLDPTVENLWKTHQNKTEFYQNGVSAEKTRVSAPKTPAQVGFSPELIHKGKERKVKESKGKEKGGELTLPVWILSNPTLLELLETWISQRAKSRKKVSQEALDLNLQKFSGRPDVLRIALETSIRNDWQGLFEPKPGDLKANGIHAVTNHEKNLELTRKLEELERGAR